MTAAPRRAGRPRKAVEGTILSAALNELSMRGIRNFRISAVAEAADVAKATIYLRWPRREELILAALRSTGADLRDPASGDLRTDLRDLVHQWSAIFSDARLLRIFTWLEADSHNYPEIVTEYRRNIALPANQIVEQVILQGQARGEVRASVSPIATARALVGGIRLHFTFAQDSASENFQEELVDLLYVGIATAHQPPHIAAENPAAQPVSEGSLRAVSDGSLPAD